LTIGFVVGALSTGGVLKTATGFVLIFPMVLLGIPILDPVLAILRRKLTGQSIGDADYGHIHHRLQQRGLSKLQALLVIIGFCITMAVGVIVAGKLGSEWLALTFGGVVLIAMIVGRVFGLYELNLIIRSLRIVHQVSQIAVEGLRARMSFLRFEASNPSDSQADSQALWSLVESCAEAVGGTRIELTMEDENGQGATTLAQWKKQIANSSHETNWDIRFSVPREDGMRVTFFATGSCPEGERTQQLENLVPLSAQICQIWPVEQPSVLSMEKHFLAADGSQPDVEREWVTEQRAA
jgi:UDP-GlcNAc:undecaprenyl-phosphate GlcNAc-1-phosphate transferase